jgi:hypothetical protein
MGACLLLSEPRRGLDAIHVIMELGSSVELQLVLSLYSLAIVVNNAEMQVAIAHTRHAIMLARAVVSMRVVDMHRLKC